MTQDEQSAEKARELMAEYGITQEEKSVYRYQGHKYDRLSDAIRYAKDGLDHTSSTASTPTD